MAANFRVVSREDGFYVQRADEPEDGPHATWLLAQNRGYELAREDEPDEDGSDD